MFDVTSLGLWPVIAFFIPVLVSLVKQAGFSQQMNAIIALIVYIVTGVVYVVITAGPAGFTAESIIASVTVATLVGTASYNLFWSNLGVHAEGDASLDDKITLATSFVR